MDGPACAHCELDEIFQVCNLRDSSHFTVLWHALPRYLLHKFASYQVYEARLFRLNKSNNGEVITSVEEAVNLQKKQSALNQFYWNLSRDDKTSDYQDNGKKRELMEKVTVRCCITRFLSFYLTLIM